MISFIASIGALAAVGLFALAYPSPLCWFFCGIAVFCGAAAVVFLK